MSKIVVKTLRGETYSFSLLSENPTVGELREQVRETINHGSDDFNLIFRGRLLSTPTMPLSHHKITNGSVLHTTQRSSVVKKIQRNQQKVSLINNLIKQQTSKKRQLCESIEPKSSQKSQKSQKSKKAKIEEINIFEQPNLVSIILSHVIADPNEHRTLFRNLRLVNKNFYSVIEFDLIRPFFYTDFVYLSERYELELIPSNLPIIKSTKLCFLFEKKFAIKYIIEMASRFTNTNKDLFTNMDKYLRYFFATLREIRYYEQFVKACKSPLLISIVIDLLTSGSIEPLKFSEQLLESFSVTNREFLIKLFVNKLYTEPLSQKFFENIFYQFNTKTIEDRDVYITQLIQLEDIQPHLEHILLKSFNYELHNLTLIKDIKFFQVVAQSKSVSFETKKKIIETTLEKTGNKFHLIPVLRLYVAIHNVYDPPNLNKYLIKFLTWHSEIVASLLNDTENVINPQCFPLDKDLEKCFEIFLKTETSSAMVLRNFDLLVNGTMFAQTTTRKFFYSVLLSSSGPNTVSYDLLNIIHKSQVQHDRVGLFDGNEHRLYSYLCWQTQRSNATLYGKTLDLFPNVNLFKCLIDALDVNKFSPVSTIALRIKEIPQADPLLSKFERCVSGLIDHDCYECLVLLESFPVLRDQMKDEVQEWYDTILDTVEPYSDTEELAQKLNNEGHDISLSDQLFRDYEGFAFCCEFDTEGNLDGFYDESRFMLENQYKTFIKTRIVVFLQALVDKRSIRNMLIVPNKFVPSELTLITIPRETETEAKPTETTEITLDTETSIRYYLFSFADRYPNLVKSFNTIELKSLNLKIKTENDFKTIQAELERDQLKFIFQFDHNKKAQFSHLTIIKNNQNNCNAIATPV